MSSSLLLDEAEVLAEEPTAEDMEDGEVSAEAEPRESRNLCRFLAAEQRILWRASLSRKIPEDNREKSTRRIQRKCANSPLVRGSGRG
jgi:chromatin segregation and condensation protein Rec8/ScpA/Scc1 (kleisin family)